jgi:uncharacterized protein YeaO (DUF488 family)
VVDRRFWIADGRRAEFEAVFATSGSWSKLLRQADGYLLTECWCESLQLSQYLVRDFWSWHRNFEIFRARFHAECEQFEDWIRSEKLVEREQFLGAYYEKSEGGSEEDLVLS